MYTYWRRKWQPTSGFLPGDSPWAEEPGGLQSMGSQSQTQLSDFHSLTHSWLIHIVRQKPTQLCKAIILQLKS